MVIDMILDRMDGAKYSPIDFYRYALAESDIFDVFDGLTKAMVSCSEEDVKRELKKYIIEQGYNPEICNYIDSVSWLEPTDETYGRMIDKISEFEKKNGYFGTVIWCDDDLKNSLENRDIESTPENVEKLKNFLLNSNNSLSDYLISIGLDFIDDTITCIFPADN